jgi:hypothetical protein
MNLDEGLYQPEGSRSSPLHLSCRAGGRHHYKVYGRGAGVGRGLGVSAGLGVGEGLGVKVGVAVGVGVGVNVAVAVAVGDAVGVAVGVGLSVGVGVAVGLCVAAQYFPPVFKKKGPKSLSPPHTSISLPLQTAV